MKPLPSLVSEPRRLRWQVGLGAPYWSIVGFKGTCAVGYLRYLVRDGRIGEVSTAGSCFLSWEVALTLGVLAAKLAMALVTPLTQQHLSLLRNSDLNTLTRTHIEQK
jgi:hypothetical protein